jgi:hypothetical protein
MQGAFYFHAAPSLKPSRHREERKSIYPRFHKTPQDSIRVQIEHRNSGMESLVVFEIAVIMA